MHSLMLNSEPNYLPLQAGVRKKKSKQGSRSFKRKGWLVHHGYLCVSRGKSPDIFGK